MKKFFIFAIAAIAATLTLTASAIAAENIPVQGEVSFESTVMPELNCTVSMETAQSIYRLVPANITQICEQEYAVVRRKCNAQSRFTHEGVKVRVLEDNGKVATIVFSLSGYNLTAKNVSWSELDKLFHANNRD